MAVKQREVQRREMQKGKNSARGNWEREVERGGESRVLKTAHEPIEKIPEREQKY